MSVSRRFIGRRTIAAVAAFSMITTGTVVAAPTVLAAPGDAAIKSDSSQKNKVTIASQDTSKIVPGSTITLKLENFADRTKLDPKFQGLVVKIDDGDVPVPEDLTGTSFVKRLDRKKDDGTYQYFGLVKGDGKVPGAKGTAELKVRLPEDISKGGHSFRILGGGEERVSLEVKFTVEQPNTDKAVSPLGRLTSKTAGSEIEGLAVGSMVDLHASRLPAGAKVIFAGPEGGDNVLPAGEHFVGADGTITIEDVKVADDTPLDIAFGIDYLHPHSGETYSVYNRRYGVTVADKNLNAEMIKVVKAERTPSGLYQSAYSAKENKLFVTRARGKDEISELMVFNPDTLKLEQSHETGPLKDGKSSKENEIFGLAIDDADGTIWATRTRGASVSVFDLKTGKITKRFDDNNHGLSHPHSIAVNNGNDTVYVSDVTSRSKSDQGKDTIKLYDAKTLEEKGTIDIASMPLGAMEVLLDEKSQKLYTVDFSGKHVAVVDLANGNKVTSIALDNKDAPGNRGAGIALDTKRDRLWVASQSPSWVKVVDLKKNEVIDSEPIRTGASPLDVLYDAKNDVIWTINRVGASVNIIDPDTMEIKATRKLDEVDTQTAYLNQLSTDGKGNVFVTSKPSRDRGTEDVLFKLTVQPEDNNSDEQDDKDTKPADGDKNKDDNDTKPADGDKNKDDKDKDKDGSAKNGGMIGAILAILALLGGIGFAALNGMIPGLVLPPLPGMPGHK